MTANEGEREIASFFGNNTTRAEGGKVKDQIVYLN